MIGMMVIQDNLSFFKHKLLEALSRAFYYPYKIKDIEQLRESLKSLKDYAGVFCEKRFEERLDEFLRLVEGINNIDELTKVEVQFVELDKPYNINLSLYESIQRSGYYDLIIVSDLRNIYNALGIDARKEPDHISTEFGFLSLMYLAKATGDERAGEVIQYFVETHLKKWVPALLDNLVNSNYPYFRALAGLAKEALRCLGVEG